MNDDIDDGVDEWDDEWGEIIEGKPQSRKDLKSNDRHEDDPYLQKNNEQLERAIGEIVERVYNQLYDGA